VPLHDLPKVCGPAPEFPHRNFIAIGWYGHEQTVAANVNAGSIGMHHD
jgi:hypothetical protein